MANFDVTNEANGNTDVYHDGSSYRFNEHGLLVVKRPDGERVTYSHVAWTRIVEEPREDKGPPQPISL